MKPMSCYVLLLSKDRLYEIKYPLRAVKTHLTKASSPPGCCQRLTISQGCGQGHLSGPLPCQTVPACLYLSVTDIRKRAPSASGQGVASSCHCRADPSRHAMQAAARMTCGAAASAAPRLILAIVSMGSVSLHCPTGTPATPRPRGSTAACRPGCQGPRLSPAAPWRRVSAGQYGTDNASACGSALSIRTVPLRHGMSGFVASSTPLL